MTASEKSVKQAARLMEAFAERTGLTSHAPKRRYLWTDAHAVCNFLALARTMDEPRYRQLAMELVYQTHRILGRFRDDDTRHGWLSGLSEPQGAAHPTQGGLRIGKPFPERTRDEPFDEALQGERDGQYFHYLTKWMHALDQVAWATHDAEYSRWAIELAQTAHRAFVRRSPGGGRRLVWKMGMDLTRPLVTGMGQHDALDGLVTSIQLESSAPLVGDGRRGAQLLEACEDFAALLDPAGLFSADPLGVGGLLFDVSRMVQLLERGAEVVEPWLLPVCELAVRGLVACVHSGIFELPPSHRLAFRELGLAIGVSSVRLLDSSRISDELTDRGDAEVMQLLSRVRGHADVAESISRFWLEPRVHAARMWLEHQDINEVMLATSLLPDGIACLPSTA